MAGPNLPDGVPHREVPMPQTHEHWTPAIPAIDVPTFILKQEQSGWEVAAVFVIANASYRCVVLKRRLSALEGGGGDGA
jgi:hypothetical protein